MARVHGPLMSLDASGSVASTITFSKWKGRNYVRELVKPSNPKSAVQRAMRASMKFLTQEWKNIGATPQADWEAIAKQTSVTGINAFVAFNQKRTRQGQGVVKDPTFTPSAAPANVTGRSGTAGVKEARLAWTDSVTATAWAVYIYRKIGSDPTGLVSELIAIIPKGVQSYVDVDLIPGTSYHYGWLTEDETSTFASAITTVTVVPTS